MGGPLPEPSSWDASELAEVDVRQVLEFLSQVRELVDSQERWLMRLVGPYVDGDWLSLAEYTRIYGEDS
jgi:hypothetical protein